MASQAVKFFDSVSEAIDIVNNYSRTHFYNPLECEGSVTWYRSMQILLAPAILLIVVLSFSVRRKKMYLDVLDGRPALIYPMSMLTTSERMSYVACFGVISTLIFKIVFESKQAINYEGPVLYRSLVTIVSMLIYSINCFPIFASVTIKNVFSYGLGSLYIWVFTVINILSNFDCPEMSDSTMFAYNLESFPQTVCLVYLSIRLPYAFVVELMRWQVTGEFVKKPTAMTFERIRESYQGIRVNTLLAGVGERMEPVPVTCSEKMIAWISRMYRKWIYDWNDTFRFSSRIITTLWVGFVLLYYITFKSIWNTTSYSLYVKDVAIYALDEIGWSDKSGESEVKRLARDLIKLYYYAITVLWILFIICFVLAFVIGTLSIIYSLTAYRKNLSAIHRGDFTLIRPRSCKTNTGLLTSSMKYAGYQVGYIAWAFFIQSAFFIFSITVVVFVIVILFLGFQEWVNDMIDYLVFWLVAFVIFIVGQYLLARFVFLQNYKESVAIDNKRGLFLATYVLFFYNVFVGLGSCLVRLALSLLMGVLNVSRLDSSLLSRRYELLDGGFDRYIGFLHVEAYHTHHAMLVFVEILKLQHRNTKAKMMGHAFQQVAQHVAKKKRLATRFQEVAVRFMFPKVLGSTPTPCKNQIGAAPENTRPQTQSNVKIDFGDEVTEKENGDEKGGGGGGGNKNEKMPTGKIRPGGLTGSDVEKGDSKVPWEVVRESPEMKRHRRKQAAVFNWRMAYTLMSNPQLKVLRKGVLQQRLKDAEMGIRGKLVG